MTASAIACEWTGYLADDFRFGDFPAGAPVLDIGFGAGEQMRHLRAGGCRAFGLEVDPALAAQGRAQGLDVCRAVSESLPFADATFDGIICKVVVPYTDEARAIAEIGRVLRRGGSAKVSYHGLGYNLRYLIMPGHWKRRVYAARVIANTAYYRATGRRLPGFWGDTVYQTNRVLEGYYRAAGLEVVRRPETARFLGAPVFIYHELRKR